MDKIRCFDTNMACCLDFFGPKRKSRKNIERKFSVMSHCSVLSLASVTSSSFSSTVSAEVFMENATTILDATSESKMAVVQLVDDLCTLVALKYMCEEDECYYNDYRKISLARVAYSSTSKNLHWIPSNIGFTEFISKGDFGTLHRIVHAERHSVASLRISGRNDKAFQREIDIWKVVTGHPYVLRLIATFVNKDMQCFVAEAITGCSLKSIIQFCRAVSPMWACVITAQLSNAVLYLHSKGIFHRDITSSNVYISARGLAKISNFRIATCQKFCQGIYGSWNYTAPEVFAGMRYGSTADWYSVGVCLYEMLMGSTPLEFYCMQQNIDTNKLDFTGRLVVALSMTVYILHIFLKPTMVALSDFLTKEPKNRLGHEEDIDEFKSHPFFSNVDWDKIVTGSLEVPLKDEVYDLNKLREFGKQLAS